MKEHVKRQYDVLNFITNFITSFGFAPTYKEICIGCKIKSRSHAYRIVKHLINLGKLEKLGKRNRNRIIALPQKNDRHNEFQNSQNNIVRGIYIYD